MSEQSTVSPQTQDSQKVPPELVEELQKLLDTKNYPVNSAGKLRKRLREIIDSLI